MLWKEIMSIKNFFLKEKEEIYEIVFCFIICGIIGWIFETSVVLIQMGMLTDRGILFISHINEFPFIWGFPFIMIYGIGGALMIWGFKPLAKKPVLLVIFSIVILTALEYFTAVVCENLFGEKLWDYSNHFMNFQGRICLSSSLAWGVLSLLAVKFFGPAFLGLYNKIKRKEIIHAVVILLFIYILICYYLRPIMFPGIIDELGQTAGNITMGWF